MKKRYHLHFAAFFSLVAVSMALVLFLGPSLGKITGFAVYNQGNQSEFDLGNYSNTAFSSGAIQLSSGKALGNYTSKIFSFDGESVWNNLSWTSNSYGALPDNAVDENVFFGGNTNMTNNQFLYHLDEASANSVSGSDFEDSSGNNYHGNESGSLTYNSLGRIGRAATFSGNDAIEIGDVEMDSWTDVTVSAWIKTTTTTGSMRIVSKDQVGIQGNFLLFFVNGVWKFEAWDTTVVDWGIAEWTSTSINDGNWHSIVGVVDNSANLVRLYVDGYQVGTDTFNAATLDDSDDEIVVIGSDSDSSGHDQNFVGALDEVAIWDRALSSTEVLNMHNRGATNLNVSVRSCNDGACNGESFANISNYPALQNLSVDNNTYFQYKFTFDTINTSVTPKLYNVSVDYSVSNSAPNLAIVQPTNTLYSTNISIPLNFTISDDIDAVANLSCWYNVDNSANTSITGCANTTFNTSEGAHTLNLFSNDTSNSVRNTSVDFTTDPTGVTISIDGPTGTQTSRTSIALNYAVAGKNLTCWYNLKTSIGGAVIDNTTLANCANTTFDVSNDGDFVLNLYSNNTLGSSDSDSSSFTISTSSTNSSSTGSSSGGGGGSAFVGTYNKFDILDTPSDLILSPGSSKKVTLSVKNSGVNFLNKCQAIAEDGYSSWISPSSVKDLAAGEEYDFVFSVAIPNGTSPGAYLIPISLNCGETLKSVNVSISILEEKLQFKVISVNRENDGKVKILYSLGELTGEAQNVDLEILVYSLENKVAEAIDSQTLEANSFGEYSLFIEIPSSVSGELELLANYKSDSYTGFTKEEVLLGKSITGFSVFSGDSKDVFFSIVIAGIFLTFAVVVGRRIWLSRRH